MSPSCDAVTVQLPAAVMVMVLPFVPLDVQLPVAANVTGLVEPPPVALTVNGASPYVLLGRVPKRMAWSALLTVWTTAVAVLGAEAVSPPYEAVIECEPTLSPFEVRVARPALSRTRVAIWLPPSKNVTFPVGIGVLPFETVAV